MEPSCPSADAGPAASSPTATSTAGAKGRVTRRRTRFFTPHLRGGCAPGSSADEPPPIPMVPMADTRAPFRGHPGRRGDGRCQAGGPRGRHGSNSVRKTQPRRAGAATGASAAGAAGAGAADIVRVRVVCGRGRDPTLSPSASAVFRFRRRGPRTLLPQLALRADVPVERHRPA